MSNEQNKLINIDPEKFRFVNENEKLHDKMFEDKPIGFLKDAWIRFRKSRASVVAAIIIIIIFLFSFIAPLCVRGYDQKFMVVNYAKNAPRITLLRDLGFKTGYTSRSFSSRSLMKALAVGVGAEDYRNEEVSFAQAMDSEYMPILEVTSAVKTIGADKQETTTYTADIETYLEVGFQYRSIEQKELQNILDWEKETGKHILYPLVQNNEYCMDTTDANCWYKTDAKGTPLKMNEKGTKYVKVKEFSKDMVLEDNYKRDADGNPIYYEYNGGGDVDTAQYKIRVLYINYYEYLFGHEPNYIMGTDAQGRDLMLRLAGGIRLSFFIAIFVSVVNFVLGALYGAVEGYYGGWIDLILERIAEILWDVPFIVVATLFQIHLAQKVGPIVSLLFAYISTGWIGTASLVRHQFYRFKNQEYVMAARTLGAKDRRIIWKHIFPNSLGTFVTSSAMVIPATMKSESMLSYLGIVKLGTANQTSLGTLLSDASSIWMNYPHLMFFPAATLSLLMICFNLFGNGLRDAFNPALRGADE